VIPQFESVYASASLCPSLCRCAKNCIHAIFALQTSSNLGALEGRVIGSRLFDFYFVEWWNGEYSNHNKEGVHNQMVPMEHEHH
jgi:hypothetical protein